MLSEWMTRLVAGLWLAPLLVMAGRWIVPGVVTTVQRELRQRGLERMMRGAAPRSRFVSFDGPAGWFVEIVVGEAHVDRQPSAVVIATEAARDARP